MQNNHNFRLLKDKKKRSLLINSESIKDYPSLYQFLLQNEEITDELISKALSEEDKRVVNDLLPNIINTCQDEWVGDEYPFDILEGDNRIPCSLCGAETKQIFYITNKISGKSINVGSSCINEFSMESLRFGKSKNQLIKQGQRNLRLKTLNDRFPGIQDIVETWAEELYKFEVLIPYQFENPYIANGEVLKIHYNDFLDGKVTNNYETIENCLLQRQTELEKMREYTEKVKDDKFVVSRDIVKWLQRKGDKATIEELKQTGFISFATVSKIDEDTFIGSILGDLNKRLSDFNVEIINVDKDNKTYIIKPFIEHPLLLTCHYKSFMEYFSWFLFGEEGKIALSLTNIFKVSRLRDEQSKITVLNELNRKLSRMNLRLRFQGSHDYFQFNELDIIDRRDPIEVVVVRPLNEFVENYKLIAFGLGKDTLDEIIKELDAIPRHQLKRYSQRELREIRKVSSL